MRIANKLRAAWDGGAKSALIVSPTGSGKTFMALSACKELVDNAVARFGCQPGEVGVAWFAHRRELLNQAELDNNALVHCPNLHTISIFDAKPERHVSQYRAVIMVVDEGHHAACNSAITCWLRVKPALMVGMSATPQRTDRSDLGFQTQISDAGYHRLIQEGWLSQYDHYMFDGLFTPSRVAQIFLREPARWGQSAIYFRTMEECEEVAQLLTAGGVRVGVVTGNSDREQQLADFSSHKLDVLVNMMVLTEGWDYPALKTVFIRDTENKGVVTQAGGRVVRLCPEVGTKQIVQSLGSKMPFTRIAAARNQIVEVNGEWCTVGINDLVRKMSGMMLERLRASKPVDLPKYISMNKKSQSWPPKSTTTAEEE